MTGGVHAAIISDQVAIRLHGASKKKRCIPSIPMHGERKIPFCINGTVERATAEKRGTHSEIAAKITTVLHNSGQRHPRIDASTIMDAARIGLS